MPPVAETKTDELISQLNQMAKQPEIDQLQLHRIKAEAKSLLQADAAEAHMVLGMAASLELDYDEVQSRFDAAIQFRPTDTAILANYSRALRRVGLLDLEHEISSKSYFLTPTDPLALKSLIYSTAGCGRFREAHNLIPKWNALCPDRKFEALDSLENFSSFLYQYDISDSTVNWLQRETSELARDEREYIFRKLSFNLMCDEESEWLAFECELAAPIDYIVEINDKLAGVLAGADLPDHIAPLLTSLYIPWEPDVDDAA